MPEPITITIEQSRRFAALDRFRLIINGEPDPQPRPVWAGDRSSVGYGHGPYGQGTYGRGRGLGYGEGAYGRGPYGQGVRLVRVQTSRRHPAGDYTVTVQPEDQHGNVGEMSAPIQVQHRPIPTAVTSLRLDGNAIAWNWSDTA